MRYTIFCWFTVAALMSCGNDISEDKTVDSDPQEKSIPNDKLYGVWEGATFRVIVNSVENQVDSSFIFDISEADWETELQVKPVKTIFLPDSTYVQEFRGLNGDLYDVTKGLWNTYGDTLMLLEREATYIYGSRFNANGLLELRSLVDWDGDGQEDDEYTATHRLIGRDVRAYQ